MNTLKFYLLPNYFKKIAVGLFVLVILFNFWHLSTFLSIGHDTGNLILKNGLLIALLIPAITKDKVEDELTINIRMNAFVSAFFFGVLFIILAPLTNLVLGGGYENIYGANQLIFTMLLVFHFIYFSTKRAR